YIQLDVRPVDVEGGGGHVQATVQQVELGAGFVIPQGVGPEGVAYGHGAADPAGRQARIDPADPKPLGGLDVEQAVLVRLEEQIELRRGRRLVEVAGNL